MQIIHANNKKADKRKFRIIFYFHCEYNKKYTFIVAIGEVYLIF